MGSWHLTATVLPDGNVTDLRRLLDTAARVIKRRSLIVLVSDFISEPGWERSLARLTERHEVVAVRLFDPREYELPDAGLIAVQDAETGEQLMVDSSDPEFRRRLRRAGEERAIAVRDASRRAATACDMAARTNCSTVGSFTTSLSTMMPQWP